MDFLKPVLGDELYAQVEEKLKGNDKIKLANLADGGYVAKKKFDDTEAERLRLDGENQTLKKVDATALQTDNERLKGENAALQLGRKLDAALYTAQAKNVTAVGALLDMSKISVDDKGNLVGADEQIKALQQSQAWAFGQASVPGAGGNPPPAAPEGSQKTTWGAAIEERIAQQ
jgi:hypothetical protein